MHENDARGRIGLELVISFVVVAETAGLTIHGSDTYREDGVAALAVHVAELLLLRRRRLLWREVLVGQGEHRLRHRHRRHHRAKLLCFHRTSFPVPGLAGAGEVEASGVLFFFFFFF